MIAMRPVYTITIILFLLVAVAQADKTTHYSYGEFVKGSTVYLFGDRVNIRQQPGVQGKPTHMLPVGHPVTIQQKSENTYTSSGFVQNWYKIAYNWEGSDHSGFIWGGLLSLTQNDLSGNRKLVTGITGFNASKQFTGEARLIHRGKVISTIQIIPHYTYGSEDGRYYYYTRSSVIGNMGLESIDRMIKLYFGYDACMHASGDIYVGIAGNRLVHVVKTSNIGDAGVFRSEEKAVFPGDKGGIKNTVIVIGQQYQFDEGKSNYKLTGTEKKVYRWDGKGFTADTQ